MIRELRKRGLQYNSRKHLIYVEGKREFEPVFRYAGANDKAGPNYTGQPTVDSYYFSAPERAG
jgi:hypothetical protein